MARSARMLRGKSVREATPTTDPRLHVLLVEDDAAFGDMVQAVLATDPDTAALQRAGSLADARAILCTSRPDAVLLDLNLPDSQGLGTLRAVVEAAPQVAVVVLTGVADTRVAHDALRLGAQDWLVKGHIDPDLLQRAVRYAVERKRLGDGLVRAQKMEVAGRLATGVAHEFNNVLTAILGSAHLVEASTSEDDRAGAMDLLRRAARQGTALSQQLLSLARNPPNNVTIVAAQQLVDNALPLVQAILPSTIALTIGPIADVDVRVDTGQFDQTLLNLVLNAKDAMPEGGTLRVRVDLEWPADERPRLERRLFAVFRVIDSGHGIDEAILPRLFEPFFSTKGWRGTGLGLAVSAEIVERFGGAIHVDSRVGSGTTVAIWLPAIPPPAAAEEGGQ